MVQLTLPAAKPTRRQGPQGPAPGAKNVKTYKVYRYDPEVDADPRWDTFEVASDDHGPMLLDALIHIKNEIDPTLTFRRSCREGICGSCSMNIDGRNTLACTKGWDECSCANISIAPLPHQPVVKDLVTDLTLFYAQYDSIQPYLHSPTTPSPRTERMQSPEDRAKLDGLYECILCACCSTSCPSYWWNQTEVPRPGGPAAVLSLDRSTAATTRPTSGSTTSRTRSSSTAATRS